MVCNHKNFALLPQIKSLPGSEYAYKTTLYYYIIYTFTAHDKNTVPFFTRTKLPMRWLFSLRTRVVVYTRFIHMTSVS